MEVSRKVNGAITGTYLVRRLPQATGECERLFPKARDFFELRKHALKLRFWPERQPETEGGELLDLDWEWIKALPGLRIGELRINDEIAGNDNLRVVFYVADQRPGDQRPIIWILSVLQKKRQDWSTAQVKSFKMRRLLVLERYYNNHF